MKTTTEAQLISKKGKFTIWKVEYTSETSGEIGGKKYELRKGSKVVERFDDEREAVDEMLLQDRIEAQNRTTDVGM